MANTQEYSTIVRLNATEARNQLDALTKKVNDLQKARDKALAEGKDTKFVKELNKELKQASAELRSYETNVKATIDTLNNLSEATVGEIEKAIRAIKKEMKQVSDPAEYKKLNQHLESLKGKLADIRGEVKQSVPLIERINNAFNKWQGSILAAVGALTGLTMTVRKATGAYGDMEEEMASVRKYTGMSDEAVRELNEDLKKIDTRTTRENLNQLSGAAGRLGIEAKDKVLEFVDAADKIGVSLGDDLGDGAVDKVGKLAMAFGEDDKKGLRGAMLATGSAINELSASSSANAGYLVEFTARLAGVGTTFKLTQADIMGLGAVLDENMQQSEMASTALSQTLMKMAADSSKFAKIAGRDIKEFGDLVKRDANAALLQFLEGLKGLGDETTVINALDALSLDGTRAAGVLMALADKTEDIARLQALANKEYNKGTSVLNEFNIQNNTVNAQLDKNKKKFKEVMIQLGEKLLPVVKNTITGFSLFAKTLLTVINFISQNIATLTSLATAIAAYTVAVNLANIKTATFNALQTAGAAATSLYSGVVKTLTAAKIALQIIMAKLEGNWARQNALMLDAKRIGVSLASGYGALISAAIILGTVIYTLIQRYRQQKEEMERNNVAMESQKRLMKDVEDMHKQVARSTSEEITKINHLNRVIESNVYTLGERRAAIREIQKIIPGYQASISNEGVLHVQTANAIKAHIEQLQNLAMAEALYDKVKKLEGDRAEALLKRKRKENNVKAVETEINRRHEHYNAMQAPYGMEGLATPSQMVPTHANIQKHQELKTQQKAVQDAKREEETIGKEIEGLLQIAQSNDTTWKRYNEISSGRGSASFTPPKTPKGSVPISGGSSSSSNSGGRNTPKKDDSDEKEEKERQERIKRELEDLKNLYEEEELLAQKDYYSRILNEQEYLDNLSDLRIKYQAEKLFLLKKNNADEAEIEQAQNDLKSQILKEDIARKKALFEAENKEEEKRQKELEHNKQELMKKFLDEDVEKTKESYRKMAEELLKAGEITQEEFDKINKGINDIGKETKEVSTNGLDWFSAGIIETAMAVDTLIKKLAEGKQSWEDYAAVGMAAVSTIMNGLSSLGDYYRASADADVKREEEKYDRMIDAAGKNRKQTEKLEKEKQAAIAKIKNEANEKQMKIQVAQAIAQGAQAAINAYSSAAAIPVVGYTIAPIAAAAAVAATALQIATIKKQAEAQRETGYYTGGFTGGNNYRKEAGVVHEGEFVANHHAVNNHQILPALQLIDQAQRNNTIGSLTAADVSAAMGQNGNVAGNISDNKELAAAIVSMNVVVARLNAELEKGIDAKVYTEGEYGIARSMEWHNKIYGGL